ncbi:autophagy-related protein 7 [Hordeum vulgare]|nr:autophagy-related protein 7 [Hordeum vulgare]
MRTRWPLPGDEVLIDNDRTHGKEVPPVHVTVDFLDSYYKSVMLAGRFSTDEIIKGKMPSSAAPPMLEKTAPLAKPWPNPTLGLVALSVDGSFDGSDGSAAAGMVLRDNNGQLIFSAYRVIFHCNDALEAELNAILQGKALAIQHSALPVVVQSDSAEALSSLLSKGLERSTYGHLVLEIKDLMCNREFYPHKNSS